MPDFFSHTRSSTRRKISTGALPTLATKVGSGSTKAMTWIGHQIRKARRDSDCSDNSQQLWGTSKEIYPQEPMGPTSTLPEGYVPLSQFQLQKGSADLVRKGAPPDWEEAWDPDRRLTSTPIRYGSADSNVAIVRPPNNTQAQSKRLADKFDLHRFQRMLEPVELHDRPWSGEFRNPFDDRSSYTSSQQQSFHQGESTPNGKYGDRSRVSPNRSNTKITAPAPDTHTGYFTSALSKPRQFFSNARSSGQPSKTEPRPFSTGISHPWFRKPYKFTSQSRPSPGRAKTNPPSISYQMTETSLPYQSKSSFPMFVHSPDDH